ncbi:hypothetical protein H6776_01945 [Candidatus Nomurabacteria bacterium]|nr:hypothetical protein [Candidatus Nomurabacteria bacterium]
MTQDYLINGRAHNIPLGIRVRRVEMTHEEKIVLYIIETFRLKYHLPIGWLDKKNIGKVIQKITSQKQAKKVRIFVALITSIIFFYESWPVDKDMIPRRVFHYSNTFWSRYAYLSKEIMKTAQFKQIMYYSTISLEEETYVHIDAPEIYRSHVRYIFATLREVFSLNHEKNIP